MRTDSLLRAIVSVLCLLMLAGCATSSLPPCPPPVAREVIPAPDPRLMLPPPPAGTYSGTLIDLRKRAAELPTRLPTR